ncbi:Inosose isomerase [Crateriforma conspicua]|nr:Inosose isomerase [Crateriforma conspicua]
MANSDVDIGSLYPRRFHQRSSCDRIFPTLDEPPAMRTHRRRLITLAASGGLLAAMADLIPTSIASAEPKLPKGPETAGIGIALNTSTIRGQKLDIRRQIDVTAAAGYDGIEPWIRDLRKYVDDGGDLDSLKRQIDDAGLKVVSAIGFAQWIVDDPEQRAAGLAEARRDMELVRAIGGTHMAAPPVGVHRPKPGDAIPSLKTIAQRYHDLLDVGADVGVIPMLELWGFSPVLGSLGDLAYVSAGAMHPDACVLPDFYHIYKGGNDFAGLGMIEASRMPVFHINDYPDQPGISEIADKDRVFPGDGVCPLVSIIAGLIDRGFCGTFSLELFNPDYWKRDAADVAREGYEKSQKVLAAAVAESELSKES